MRSDTAIGALAALAQTSRLAVFRRLVAAGPEGLAAGAIAEALDVPPATLSFHLKELARARLVRSRRRGRFVIYSAEFDRIGALIGYLTENCCCATGAACLPPICGSMPTRAKRRPPRTAGRARRRR
ncbi:MAG: helix-turn-helix domain-containing protein [Burkholderiales bacterium]|nr:helix-turn-helix domain-containing protein [Burkholderiales bacterium]